MRLGARARAQDAGFTLLELMLVVGITGVLAAIAIGMSGTFNREQYVKDTARAVLSTLGQARAEAIRSSTKVSVLVEAQKITAFVDANGNFLVDTIEKVLYRYPQGNLRFPLQLTAPNLASAASSNQAIITFDYQGYSRDPQNAFLQAVVCVRDPGLINRNSRAVQLAVSGAARIAPNASFAALCP